MSMLTSDYVTHHRHRRRHQISSASITIRSQVHYSVTVNAGNKSDRSLHIQ